jgi:hypothetical protein
MWGDFFSGLTLIDLSGYIIIAVILLTLVIAVGVNMGVRRRYREMERDLRQHAEPGDRFRHRVLTSIVRAAEATFHVPETEPNFQALIEHHFKRAMSGALMAERFLKSAAGLMIVLGLVGTFYGLTLSIGKLVTLITGDVSGVAEITESLTTGLAGALSGMSVAFSTSLFGIVSSIVVILLNVFSSLADRRAALMLKLEVYLDDLRLHAEAGAAPRAEGASLAPSDAETVRAIESFGTSVGALQEVVSTFDTAMQGFSKNTRDFQELNLHLKDNIQRMSLGFADLGETLKSHVARLTPNRPRP